MKIRIAIVPPERLQEDISSGKCRQLLAPPRSMDREISLRSLIGRCQPIAHNLNSWSELGALQCTAWLCVVEGTDPGQWSWAGCPEIKENPGYPYHDINIEFEEVGSPQPHKGLYTFCNRASKDSTLEDILVPEGKFLTFFPGGLVVPGRTDVYYEIYGRVPKEWEDEVEVHVVITSIGWLDNPEPKTETETPEVCRNMNEIFLRNLINDTKDE